MNNASEKLTASLLSLGLDAPAPHIAVAVSGGGDSLALTLLLNDWANARGGKILALTVDHGLRDGSAAEAAALNAELKKRGIAHEILNWQGDKPSSHIQERAREMRYKLLAQKCAEAGFDTLAVAHNAEDRMETFWMRLAHGSGLDGLAGMAASVQKENLRIIRPLLDFSRAELRDVCAAYGATWAEDPSNTNEKFLRPRLRGFEDMLAAEGLTPQRLALTLQKLGDARGALQSVTARALAAATHHDAGYVTIAPAALLNEHADIQRRMLSQILHAVAPQDYRAGHDALEHLRADIARETFNGSTVAGCEIFPSKGVLVFCRELAASAAPAPLQNGMVWDGRFRVSGYPVHESLTIGVAGEAGVSILRKQAAQDAALARVLAPVPAKLLRVFAGIWHGQNLVAVPHLSWFSQDCPAGVKTAEIAPVARVNIV
jgi:tRNA(Ile)-lysidine synthase